MSSLDLTNKKFTKLTVISKSHIGKSRHVYWKCQCDCGKIKIIPATHLRSGKVKSCGCYNRESKTKHGYNNHPVYNTYKAMMYRCYNNKSEKYKNYGGRGIEVCKEWKENISNFIHWAEQNGFSPELSLDRINNDGNYCPENCRFTDIKTQSLNKRNTIYITAFNETKPLLEWSEDIRCVVKYDCLHNRLQKGWSTELAITTPSTKNK